jgi:hypothetical protein
LAGRLWALALIGAVLAAPGCSGEDEPEPTGFEAALDTLGVGVSPTGAGFGWADIDALRGYPVDTDFRADALGPGADDLFDVDPAIFRVTRFDPGYASAAIAEGGSYAFGVRFDGVDPGRLERLLLEAGARTSTEGSWTLYDLGRPAEGPTSGPLAPFGALISRAALRPDAVVLSRFEPARASLTGDGGSLTPSPALEAAADCLGDVDAARTIPAAFTHNKLASPDLIAIGVEPLNEGVPPHEVLCAIDDSAERSEARAAALERAFAAGASDPLTGAPIATEVQETEVTREERGGYAVARAELEPVDGARPGLLFRAFARGSLLIYLGADRPAPGRP